MDFKKLLSKEFFAAVTGVIVLVLIALNLESAASILCDVSNAVQLEVAACVQD